MRRVYWTVDAISAMDHLDTEPSTTADALLFNELTASQALRRERRYLNLAGMTRWSGTIVRCRVQSRSDYKYPCGERRTYFLTYIINGQVDRRNRIYA